MILILVNLLAVFTELILLYGIRYLKMSSQVRKATSEYDSNIVGVYVISYGELVPILIQAPSHEGLNNINWYGSEATSKNERLLKHQKAAEFADKTILLVLY
jgi:hypothetical protein